MPAAYQRFSDITGIRIKSIQGRNTANTINQRRLFIAIALYLYDPMHMHNYSGRLIDKLRASIADLLHCHEVWVNNVIESMRFEYFHIDTFQLQVNMLAYCIKMQLQQQHQA